MGLRYDLPLGPFSPLDILPPDLPTYPLKPSFAGVLLGREPSGDILESFALKLLVHQEARRTESNEMKLERNEGVVQLDIRTKVSYSLYRLFKYVLGSVLRRLYNLDENQ